MDFKHIIGAVIGAALAFGISYLGTKGIDVQCPVASSISQPAK